jgi:decaprenyl-phosphate phosphoribosyltransferase
VAVTFVAFCLLSAGTYMVNDVRDAVEDRDHPRKRHRPVAAGDLDGRTALAAGAAAMVAGLLLCLLVRPLLVAVGGGYLAVTLTYSLVWRGIALADVAAIAAGFVLRALAGGVAAPVGLSRSFVLVVTFGAVFVAAGKRHAELARPRDPGFPVRRVLAVYTLRRLRQILLASAGLAVAAYCVWALGPHSARGLPWRALTIAPFAACLARYGVLLRRGAGETPEEILLDDRILQVFALIWTVAFALSVHDTN